MSDRLPSDHPSVETHRATIERRGRVDRPRLDLSDVDSDLPVGEAIRLDLDGETYHARTEETFEGDPEVRGVYDNPRLARDPESGTDRLAEWQVSKELDFGRSVCFDVVVPDHAYGLRVLGERTIYAVTDPPTESLRDIARSLEDDR
jgi:hypothetical protein